MRISPGWARFPANASRLGRCRGGRLSDTGSCRSARSCALLDRDEVVLGGSHRQLRAARARRQLRAAPRTSGGCPRGLRRAGGIVISPATGTGACSMKASSSSGAMPDLPGSPATLTSIRISKLGRARARWRRARAARSRRRRSGSGARAARSCVTLRVCSAPMKSHRTARRGAGDLRGEVLRAVLADELDAGLGERRQVLRGDVLGRGEHSTPPGSCRPRDAAAVDLLADAREAGADLRGR